MNQDCILWLALLYLLKRSGCFSNCELLCFLGMIACRNFSFLTANNGNSASAAATTAAAIRSNPFRKEIPACMSGDFFYYLIFTTL